MKKFIYTAIALAAVAVGCTKSNIVDVPAEQKTPIAFDTYNGRVPVTRAEEITKDNIEKIYVTGFQEKDKAAAYGSYYMNPENGLVKSGDKWTYDPLSYWPVSGTLEFVAYGSNTPRVEVAEEGKLVAVDGSFANFTYTVPEATAAQQDLIAGYVGPTSATSDKVTFTMKHLLSRVGFKLQTVGSGTSVTISEVSLNGKFVNNGTVNLATETAITPKAADLTAADYTTSYSLFADGESFGITKEESAASGTPIFARYTSDGDAGSTTNTDNSNRYMMIMPGTVADNDQAVDGEIGTTPYIQVTYKLGDGAPQTKKLPLVDGDANWNFAAGTAYEFIFKVSISAIEFTGEVVDWDEDINGDGKEDADDYID